MIVAGIIIGAVAMVGLFGYAGYRFFKGMKTPWS